MAAAALMIPAAVMMMILLLNPSGCDARTSSKQLLNDTFPAGKYKVGEQDIEMEFLMESHISRILASSQNFQTTSTTDANKASGGRCGRNRYDSCLGPKRDNPKPENCDIRNRENPTC